jgi:hypothetical protein
VKNTKNHEDDPPALKPAAQGETPAQQGSAPNNPPAPAPAAGSPAAGSPAAVSSEPVQK